MTRLSLFITSIIVFIIINISFINSLSVQSTTTVQSGKTPFSIDSSYITKEYVTEWMKTHELEPFKDDDLPSVSLQKFAKAIKIWANEKIAEINSNNVADQMLVNNNDNNNQKVKSEQDVLDNEYPFWQFIPYDFGLVVPGVAAVSFKGVCFQELSAVSKLNGDGSVTLTITAEKAKSLGCSDLFLIGTVEQYKIEEVLVRGPHTFTFTPASNATQGQIWDLHTNGIRINLFAQGATAVLESVTKTAELFEPCSTQGVAKPAADVNLKFLKNYAGIEMKPRTVTDVSLDASQINSGDFFGVIRLDGLDPMLSWAMGSTTGHTTIALWGEDGQLYICESTATTSYWDVNGIQKTPYLEWLKKAKDADFNVVHIPLAPQYRAKMNITAAWEFFNKTEGINYGYDNMLWGWVDTLKDNYPCAPPDFERCLNWNVMVVLFPQIIKAVPFFESFYKQAWNFRVGTQDLAIAEILQSAAQKNIPANSIPAMVEDDTWMYNTTRYNSWVYGQSMVCCVFVCHIWKSSGVFSDFDSEVNCGELTNWDDYALTLFDPTYVRPKQCVDADPDNQACQLLGKYTLNLNNYNSKTPFAHMAEHCPSLAPNYTKPSNC